MRRYRIVLIVFIIASVGAMGWLLDALLGYSTAAFDCDLPGLYGPHCADAKAAIIADRTVAQAPVVAAIWCGALLLFVRERKKR